MRIDRAGRSDLDAVLALGATVFDRVPRADWTRQFLHDPANVLLVARASDGEPLGMLSATWLSHPDKPPELFVREVGVVDAHRRLGVGTALVEAALALATSSDPCEMWLVTSADNEPACRTYARLDGERTDGAVLWTWSD